MGKSTHVKLILGQLVKGTGVRLEVLGQDTDGVTNHHLGQQESLVLRERAIVKDQKELSSLVECLNAVRNATREVPHITRANVINKGLALVVDRRDAHATLEHQRPLIRRVPM